MEEPAIEKYSRSEKSLSTLTKKFVEMLQNEVVLDLNTATLALEVSKKRRIYDITNVLEGINLIKKAGKNLYKWKGRTDDVNSQSEVHLSELKDDQIRLQDEEKQLSKDIKILQMNLAALHQNSSKSFQYLNKTDFISAFGSDETVLIAKDYKHIKFNFDCDPLESNSLLLNNHKETELRDVHIIGDVLKPAQLRLVNSEAKQNNDPNLLFCLDDMASDDEKSDEQKPSIEQVEVKKKRNYSERSQNLNLFRRRLKHVKFWDMEEEEREKLAVSTLEVDKFKDKSMFHFINEKQLVNKSDYIEPDFINLCSPADTSYESNYSAVAPSVHDLFDIEADVPEIIYEPDTVEDYEMMEFLDDEEL